MNEGTDLRVGIGWFLQWMPGGEIRLVRPLGDPETLSCPKCQAPMLIVTDQVVCYACGMTFRMKGGSVYRCFGRHGWPDSMCGTMIAYDHARSREYYEGLRPEDLGP